MPQRDGRLKEAYQQFGGGYENGFFRWKPGQRASFTKTVSESDVYLFAGITGDFNPVHVDAISARDSIFGERVVHGIFVAGLLSAVIGTKLPGDGTIYLEQDVRFLLPVKIGDTVTAVVEVAEILNEEKQILKLDTKAVNQKNETVLDGYAVVKASVKE